MEPEIAQAIVVAITAVGVIVWMAALVLLVKVTRERSGPANPASGRFEVEETSATGTIVGEAQIDGDPEALSAKLTSLLARDGSSALGPVKILTSDRDQITFESAGSSNACFRQGRIRLVPSGSTTRVEYAIETTKGPWLFLGWLSLTVGLIALIVAPTLVCLLVLPSPNPQVRFQSIQTVQMIHFLWPPFLFAFLARQPARLLRPRMDSLIHNLPFS